MGIGWWFSFKVRKLLVLLECGFLLGLEGCVVFRLEKLMCGVGRWLGGFYKS